MEIFYPQISQISQIFEGKSWAELTADDPDY